MKKLSKIIALTLFAAASALFGTSCGDEEIIQRETKRSTTIAPYGMGSASETTTTTTTVVDD